MGCMDEALDSLFPVDWLDPYGQMPMNDRYSVQIDITQVKTDNGIKVTAVKTPPRAGTASVSDAIKMALGVCDIEDNEQNGSNPKEKKDYKEKSWDPKKTEDKPTENIEPEQKDLDHSPRNLSKDAYKSSS